MTTLDLDTLQQRWQAQDAKLDQALRMNTRLWQRLEMTAPRASMGWLRVGSVFNILFGGAFLLWTGSFIHEHWGEWQLVLPAVTLHVWLIAALGTTVAELALASGIDYDAPIVTIQAKLEALRALNLRALRWLFLTGVPVWTVSFMVVAFQSWFGIDLNLVMGSGMLFALFLVHVGLGVAVVWACRQLATRYADSPTMQRIVGGLAGYNLAQAEARLGQLAAFERGD